MNLFFFKKGIGAVFAICVPCVCILYLEYFVPILVLENCGLYF